MTRQEKIDAIRAEAVRTAEDDERRDAERRLTLMNVPRNYWDVSMDLIPDRAEHKAKLRTWHERFLEELRAERHPFGLYLFGPVGSGKSAIAAGILRWAIRYRAYGYFLPAADLVRVAMEDPPLNDLVDEGVWSYARRVKLLVLDDLGRGGGKNSYGALMWDRAEELLRCRLSLGLTTVITSNADLDDLGQQHPGLASVVRESCYELKIAGVDYRVGISKQRLPL